MKIGNDNTSGGVPVQAGEWGWIQNKKPWRGQGRMRWSMSKIQPKKSKTDSNELQVYETLLEKSQEAFTLALELYNRPTIKYRVEAFSFFICNAWELMLKAHLISLNGFNSIFYRDNPSRTIALSDAIKRVFTDKREPLRMNLEKIISLRDTSTHFVTVEYEQLYAELFQSAVFNYVNKFNAFFNVDVTERFDQHFLSLSVNVDGLDVNSIKSKYPKAIAEQILKESTEIRNATQTIDSTSFSIPIDHTTYITKNRKDADFIVSVVDGSDDKVAIINRVRDPKNTHPYSFSDVVAKINDWIRLKKIKYRVSHPDGIKRQKFNSSDLSLFIKFYDAKSNPDYAYKHQVGNTSQFTYSQKLVNLIERQITKHPWSVITNLKKAIDKSK
ncbi:DUF3644 domain-containing protein [Lacticaseibacillus paracasei]|uniref:DUF3644 domain-containing protein n=1 Tax=Lacticaseibacillus paracasei TaxID=1597 RepID=UPI00195BDB0B|nr:DUF3644 domain-containing protein [Lacticaseibacillus paracasei]